MTNDTRTEIETLETLRLPELQARFEEVVGEPTRCPNRTYLMRRITEALEGDGAQAPTEEAVEAAPEEEALPADAASDDEPEDSASEDTEDDDEPEESASDEPGESTNPDANEEEPQPADAPRPKLTKLSVPELQALYVEVVGRPTSSANKRYLVWKIREAQRGRVPVGPRRGRRGDGPAPEHKVLPLRMEAEQVARLDEARSRLGLKSRMDLFRRALHAYLEAQGEQEVAALFATDATTEA